MKVGGRDGGTSGGRERAKRVGVRMERSERILVKMGREEEFVTMLKQHVQCKGKLQIIVAVGIVGYNCRVS